MYKILATLVIVAILAITITTNKNPTKMNDKNNTSSSTPNPITKNDSTLIEPSEKPFPTPSTTYNNFEATYKEDKISDNEIRKRMSLIEGIEIWSVIRDPAEDPVHVDYWLVTNKSKNRMDPRLLTNSLKDINFSPKNDNDALLAAKLAFDDGLHTVIDQNNIQSIKVNLPDEIKNLPNIPKITKKDNHYIVDINVYYFDKGQKRFFNIDSRALVRYQFEVGTSYINQTSAETIWMANPPTTLD